MRKPNERLAEAVQAVLDERGLTQRGQRSRTGVSHVTVQGMLNGVVPQMETVAAFARGFGLDVNEWLELAGYEPVEPSADDAAESLLGAADRQELTYEPDFSDIRVEGFQGVAGIDPGDVAILNEVARTVAARIAKRKGRG